MNSQLRNKVRGLIQSKLECSQQRANNIERWIHNYYLQYKKTSFWYTSKCRSVLWNTRFENYKDQLNVRDLNYDEVLTQKPQDIYPELWKEAIRKAQVREIRRTMCLEEPQDGIYNCRKCHKNKTKHFTYQTRAADEPETIYVSCFLCGTISKING